MLLPEGVEFVRIGKASDDEFVFHQDSDGGRVYSGRYAGDTTVVRAKPGFLFQFKCCLVAFETYYEIMKTTEPYSSLPLPIMREISIGEFKSATISTRVEVELKDGTKKLYVYETNTGWVLKDQ